MVRLTILLMLPTSLYGRKKPPDPFHGHAPVSSHPMANCSNKLDPVLDIDRPQLGSSRFKASSDLLTRFILPQRKSSFWNTYYADVAKFVLTSLQNTLKIDGRKDHFSVVEIGTAWGGNAEFMTHTFANADVYAVDPLEWGYDSADAQSKALYNVGKTHSLSKEEVSYLWGEALVIDGHRKFGCRYHLVKGYSTSVAPLFKERLKNIDFAFIDGLHTYEGVVADIKAYAPLMRPGGVIIFNDYGQSYFPGVTQAVNEFVAGSGLQLVVGTPEKPPGATNAGVSLPITWIYRGTPAWNHTVPTPI